MPTIQLPKANFTQEQLTASVCQHYFFEFVKEFWEVLLGVGIPEWNWHIRVMCEELETLAHFVHKEMKKPASKRKRRSYDLICNISPNSTKSTIFSVLFPAWVWTFFPDARFICGSHTDSLVLDLATRSRDVIQSEKYTTWYPKVKLRTDKEAKGDYGNTLGGERKSCTVGGKTPTGRHAHFCIIDDPLDPKKAASQAELDNAGKFHTQVLPSRKVDKRVCPTILVMQRLHPQDPTKVMEDVAKRPGACPIKKLCLPAELTDAVSPPELHKYYADYNQDASCAPDGLMDPVRLSREVLAEAIATLGRMGYASQFLQAPEEPEGMMFKEEYFRQIVKAAPYEARRVNYTDRAFTANDGSCNTAISTVAEHEGYWYIGPVKKGQWLPWERDERIVNAAADGRRRWGPKYEPDNVIEQEPAAGIDSYQHLAAKLAGYKVFPDPAKRNKELRAQPLASMFQAGRIKIVDDGTWDVAGWIAEFLSFPNGKFKDQVDSASGGFNWLREPRSAGTLRVLSYGGTRKKGLPRIIACSVEQLAHIASEEPALLVLCEDVKGVMCSESPIRSNESLGSSNGSSVHVTSAVGTNGNGILPTALPPHSLSKLLDHVMVTFADLDPATLQAQWNTPMEEYGKPPSELVLSRPQCKRVWACLMKKRDVVPTTFLFVDTGDRRAVSVAKAYAKIMNYEEKLVEVLGGNQVNPYIFELMKSTRGMVV